MAGFGTGFIAALSGAPGGYLDAKREMADTDIRRAQAAEAQNDVMGQAAFGRALQLMFGGGGAQGPQVPGQPAGGAAGGAGAPPGMVPPRPPADIPNAGPQPTGGAQPLTTDQLGSQPSPMGGVSPSRFNQTFMQPLLPPQGNGIPAPGSPAGPQMGGPSPQPMPPGSPPTGMSQPQGPQPQPQPQQGVLTLDNVMKMIVTANPGAPPAVIASAVNRFLPMMNAQSQQAWREISLALRQRQMDDVQGRFGTNQERLRENAANRNEVAREGLDIRRQGEERRGTESTARQSDRERRTGLAERREGRQQEDSAARRGLGERRQTLAEQRESRMAQESAARRELIKEKLTAQQAKTASDKMQADAKLKKLDAEAKLAEQRGNIQEARLKMQAMHLRSQELINEWALSGKIDPKVKAAVLEENRLMYKELIDKLGRGKQDGQDLAPGESRVTPAPQGGRPQQLRIDPASGAVSPQ